jgi:hypothetical protein
MNGFSAARCARLGFLAMWFVPAWVDTAVAEDFRIETRVYEGEEELPISEAVTLFQNGVVYDFLAAPAQIAVFSKPTADRPGRFILLDPVRHLYTELDTDRIAAALDKIRDWAVQQPNPVLRFAAAPKFQESFNPESGELALASPLKTYRLQTSSAVKPDALAEYHEYLDWYARLNAMHTGLPPQPRLEVNAALARHAVVPTEVMLVDSKAHHAIRAKHDFTWRLSQEDRSRIDEVRDAMGSYRLVENEEFLAQQAVEVSE